MLALQVLWLLAAVTVPLIFNPWGASAFELPKAVLLRALVLLMGLVTLAKAGGDRRRPSIPPLFAPVMTFALVLAASTALSINPRVSLWGSYERQQGLATQAAYLALFVLTAANLQSHAQFDRLLSALTWGSAPVVVYGLAQAAGFDPLGWRTDAAAPVLSTVGRANFLGSYLVLVAPLTLARTLMVKRRWPDGALHGALLVAQAACLLLTQARAAWVGLGAAATAFGLAWSLVTGQQRWAVISVLAALLIVGFVVLLAIPDGPLAGVGRLPLFERLAALGRTDRGSVAARLVIWRATLRLATARPWLGYGPETMRAAFASAFPPELIYYQGRHTVVDRAHNLWLDLAMTAGIVGLAAYGWLLVAIAHRLWRGLRSKGDHWHQIAWIGLTASVVGHLADMQAGFDVTTGATVSWLILALVAALSRGLADDTSAAGAVARTKASGRGEGWLIAPPAVAVLGLIGMVCVRPLLADVSFWRSRQLQRPLASRQAAAAQAVRTWPLEPVYRFGLAQAYTEGGAYEAATVQLEAVTRLWPDDPRVWSAWGDLYTDWAVVDPVRYQDAEAAYRRVLELAPNLATYHTALGVTLARQGRLADGIAAAERAVELDATDPIAYGYLAELYAAVGRDADATWASAQAARWKEVVTNPDN